MRHSLRVALAVALQLGVLVAIAGGRQWTLSRGTIVLLETAPVDPRDLFRGDYVVLAYKISTLQRTSFDYPPFNPGDAIYVPLIQRGRFWEPQETGVSHSRPRGDVFIRGRVVGGRGGGPGGERTLRVEYGIETYFVPEGRGREIETARDIAVEVALREGNAVIRRLFVGGRPFP